MSTMIAEPDMYVPAFLVAILDQHCEYTSNDLLEVGTWRTMVEGLDYKRAVKNETTLVEKYSNEHKWCLN